MERMARAAREGGGGKDPQGDDVGGSDEEPKPVRDQSEQGNPLPLAGEIDGGPLNQAAVALWFDARKQDGHVHIGVGVEGAPDAKLVAIAQHDQNHFDAEGQRLGVTMTVHDYGYSQILTGRISAIEGCQEGPGDVVYLYTGKDIPRRGYYELCRVAVPKGHLTAARLRDLDPEDRADLAALNAALLAEFNERSPLPEEARVLWKGRLLIAADGSLRGGVAIQRHGELLVAMRGKFAEGSTCGNTAVVDVSNGWSNPRIFWITGLGIEDLANDELILGTVAALWGCPTGALARIDHERKLLTTGATVSAPSPGDSWLHQDRRNRAIGRPGGRCAAMGRQFLEGPQGSDREGGTRERTYHGKRGSGPGNGREVRGRWSRQPLHREELRPAHP